MWSDIALWRQYVFSQIGNAFLPNNNQPGSSQACLLHLIFIAASPGAPHEMMCSIIQLSHVFRKAGLLDTCKQNLERCYKVQSTDVRYCYNCFLIY